MFARFHILLSNFKYEAHLIDRFFKKYEVHYIDKIITEYEVYLIDRKLLFFENLRYTSLTKK